MGDILKLNDVLDSTTTKTVIKIIDEDGVEIFSGLPQNYERKNIIIYEPYIKIERDYYVQSQSVKENVLVISVY